MSGSVQGCGITMGELMRLTGVSRATIYHYLEVGLLPQPERPNLRMAYYDPGCVDRVRVILDLKERRFMPLDAIKRVFDDGGLDGLHDLDGRLLRAMRRDADEGGDAIGRAELLEQHPVASEVLESLAGAGLVASADGPFCTEEVEVVAAVHEMREAGLNEDLGFSVDQMGLYTAALQTLIDLELATFNERVLGAVSPERAAPMAHVAVEATSRMLGALHRRLLRDRLEGLVAATDSTKERQ